MDLSILKLLTLKYYLMCFLPTNKEIKIHTAEQERNCYILKKNTTSQKC